jgi:hypothetical protein
LKNLKLRRILEIYDEQLRAADKEDISECGGKCEGPLPSRKPEPN